MLAIRLQRLGKKKSPTYRMIVSEGSQDTHDRHVEILGHYNPVAAQKVTEFNAERVKYWLSVGAQPSESVHNILVNQGVITGKKQKSVAISKKRAAKLEKKRAEEAEKKKAAEATPEPAA